MAVFTPRFLSYLLGFRPVSVNPAANPANLELRCDSRWPDIRQESNLPDADHRNLHWQVTCKDEVLEGQHQAIVDPQLFAEVGESLRKNGRIGMILTGRPTSSAIMPPRTFPRSMTCGRLSCTYWAIDHERLTYRYGGRDVRLSDVHENLWSDTLVW